MINSAGYCITCLKDKFPCDCQYCHNCGSFTTEEIYDLDGVCLLSKDGNKFMVAQDHGYPEDPYLSVSLTFSCNQWSRKP